MIDGIKVRGGVNLGAEGQPVAAVTVDFGDIGFVELPTPAAIELGMTLIHNARGADDLLSFIQALETNNIEQDQIELILASVTGGQTAEPAKRKLDVVTDPGLVKKVNP